MERKSGNRKFLRHNYRRYAAAMAGAALLSGAVLPGIPVVKAAEAEKPIPLHSSQLKKSLSEDTNRGAFTPLRHERQRDRDCQNRDCGERGRRDNWGNNYFGNNWGYNGGNPDQYSVGPIEAVKQVAADYGFNGYRDSFTLLNLTNGSATIEAIKQDTGQRYLIQLTQNFQGIWNIVSVNEAALQSYAEPVSPS